MMNSRTFTFLCVFLIGLAASNNVPAVYSGISEQKPSKLFFWKESRLAIRTSEGEIFLLSPDEKYLLLDNFRGAPHPTASGLHFDFKYPDLNGVIYFGIMSPDSRYSTPVFLGKTVEIRNGKADLNLDLLRGRYDISDWEKEGTIHLGFRVVNDSGVMLFEGRTRLSGSGPFEMADHLLEGPFINRVRYDGATISFDTNRPLIATILVNDQQFSSPEVSTHHEIQLSDLYPNMDYIYTLQAGSYEASYTLHTTPYPGSRQSFTFAYASDSRSGAGGGERSMFGVNSYMLRRVATVAAAENARFLQFTGDMISGYRNTPGTVELEYSNWKKAVEPYAHYFPVITGMGNHEALGKVFRKDNQWIFVDGFPYETHSAEAVYARQFVNPLNGPVSEDGAEYDPNPDTTDFPSYSENVFYYIYDNAAVVVMNSNYWYAPSIRSSPESGGNLHGYIMDNQLAWLSSTLDKLTKNSSIDHIFVTQHTPIFPNGGHVSDDMWYGGDNTPRPTIAGKPLPQGIIERRDAYLALLLKHHKVLAVLTGDEHNYNRLLLNEDMDIYPPDWDKPRLKITRPLWQINNGAAGAPYYGQETTPWMDHLKAFSTQNAVVLFDIKDRRVYMRVINPDTLELIDDTALR